MAVIEAPIVGSKFSQENVKYLKEFNMETTLQEILDWGKYYDPKANFYKIKIYQYESN